MICTSWASPSWGLPEHPSCQQRCCKAHPAGQLVAHGSPWQHRSSQRLVFPQANLCQPPFTAGDSMWGWFSACLEFRPFPWLPQLNRKGIAWRPCSIFYMLLFPLEQLCWWSLSFVCVCVMMSWTYNNNVKGELNKHQVVNLTWFWIRVHCITRFTFGLCSGMLKARIESRELMSSLFRRPLRRAQKLLHFPSAQWHPGAKQPYMHFSKPLSNYFSTSSPSHNCAVNSRRAQYNSSAQP